MIKSDFIDKYTKNVKEMLLENMRFYSVKGKVEILPYTYTEEYETQLDGSVQYVYKFPIRIEVEDSPGVNPFFDGLDEIGVHMVAGVHQDEKNPRLLITNCERHLRIVGLVK